SCSHSPLSSCLRPTRVNGVGEAGVDTRQVRLLLFLHLLLSCPSFLTLVVCVIGAAREKHDGAVRIERWWASSCRPQHPGARRPRPFLTRRRRTARQREGHDCERRRRVLHLHRPLPLAHAARFTARATASAPAPSSRFQRLVPAVPPATA